MTSHTADASVPALLLTERQAALALHISARKLWGLRQSGQIPCVREGRLVRYDPLDLRDWINRKKTAIPYGLN